MKKNVLTFSLFALMLSFATGCGNMNKAQNTEETTMVESSSGSSISNNINGVFDGTKYNIENYTTDYTQNLPQDINTKNGYKKIPNNIPSGSNGINSTSNKTNQNERFKGMEGAEEIIGNEEKNIKKDVDKMYDESKKMYDNIKNRIKS